MVKILKFFKKGSPEYLKKKDLENKERILQMYKDYLNEELFWDRYEDDNPFRWLHEDRLKDRDFMEQLIEIDQWVLSYADDTLKNDRELVKKAVQSDGPPVLEAVNKRFQKDKEIVLLALKKNGMAIHGVHKSLLEDREVVLSAVKSYGMALYEFDTEGELYIHDKEIVLEAVKNNYLVYKHMYPGNSIWNDPDIIKASKSRNG